ncbi:MAG: histone [Simkaniaceae bacterium]|nr:histone [Simkaniaceae bacterium]
MALSKTIKEMENLLAHINADMVKVNRGNSAAAQRVRTGTIKLEKVAKKFRKESVVAGKKKRSTRKKATAKKRVAKKAAPKKKVATKKKTATTTRRVSARRRSMR